MKAKEINRIACSTISALSKVLSLCEGNHVEDEAGVIILTDHEYLTLSELMEAVRLLYNQLPSKLYSEESNGIINDWFLYKYMIGQDERNNSIAPKKLRKDVHTMHSFLFDHARHFHLYSDTDEV
jgi:hypothetical protein